MLRRISAVLIILGGLALIILPVTEHVWSGAGPAKTMIDSFKPVMAQSAMAAVGADLQQLGAANTQLSTQVMPMLGSQLHLSPAQLQGALASNFSSVATGMAQLPGILKHFAGMGALMSGQIANFQAASTIPVSGVPMTVLPWGFALVGVLAVAFGIMMLVGKAKAPAIAALVLGIVVVGSSFALSFPQKAVAADHMITALRPVMTAQSATQMGQSLAVVGAMVNQMETQMIPYVATQLQMSPTAFNQMLGTQFPAVGTALKNMPTTAATFAGMQSKISSNLNNYAQAAAIPSMTFMVWLFIGVGVLCILGGLAGLGGATETKREEAKSTSTVSV